MKRIIFALLLLSCRHVTGPVIVPQVAVLDQPFWLDLQRTEVIQPEELRLTFNRVISDSRCPIGVECVIAGHAEPELTLQVTDSDSATFALILGPYVTKKDTRSHPFADTLGYRVTLMQLDPHPDVENVQPEPIRYRAYMRVSQSED